MTTASHPVISFAQSAVVVAALMLSGAGGVVAASLTVSDPRPVAKAIDDIERLSGKPITYEDPPYLHASTTIDVTRMIRREGSSADDGAPVLVPKGGIVTFTLPAGPSVEEEAGAVESLVTGYNAGRGAATFSVLRNDTFIHVVPRQAMAMSGRLEDVTPVLDARIKLEAKPRTALELLEAICAAASATSRQPVEIGMVPVNALRNQKIAIGADNETARTVLAKLVVANPTPLSWRLFYDPGLKTYYLNLPVVRQPAKKP